MEKRNKVVLQSFAKRLKELRKAKGMSQLDLEIETGINRTEISRIENSQKNIELFTIIKLAIALDVQIKELFS